MDWTKDENITLEQIFNADETALFFKYVPKNTYTIGSEKTASGFKEAKQRITLLACGNAAGTCKLKLEVIGRNLNPRALKGIKVLPVHYRANKKAWMTQELFMEWFNTQFVPQARAYGQSVELADDCKIILFLDNCSAHPPEALLKANNVQIRYLPPNCTSLIQPLDQGILRSLKCKYKVQFLKNLLDSSSGGKSIQEFQKEFNIRNAIWMIARAWEEVSQETLANGWRNLIPTYIFLQNEENEPPFEGFHLSKEKFLQQELLDYAKKSGSITITENDVCECFDIDRHIPTLNDVSDAELINMVLHPDESDVDDENKENSNAEEKVSNEKCIELTKQIISAMEQKSFVNESHIMAVYKIQELFLKQKSSNLKQLKVDDMFNKK